MKRLIVNYLLPVILVCGLFADGPSEQYNIKYSEIPDSVLLNCTGVLMLNVYSWESIFLQVYTPGQYVFRFLDSIDIQMETLPISNFGPPVRFGDAKNRLVVGTLRYPILENRDGFLNVIVNAITNKSVWLREDKLREKFELEILMLDEMDEHTSKAIFIDILFNPTPSIKIFNSPSHDSEFQSIPREDFQSKYHMVHFNSQSGNFIHLYSQSSECAVSGPVIDIGWLPIHDDAGKLSFWIKNSDDC
ncbi:MAG: hypothetical protein H8D23_39025 [Candidatus Brocadiales bacterium]|nr:hypothetical protein [Candidatus Brocadiales bacterium]